MAADIERVRSALAYIDSGDWATWVRVGLALHTEYGNAGFDLWDAWSTTAPNYNERAAQLKWRSISGSNRRQMGIGSVFALARDRGWAPPENPPAATRAQGQQRRNDDGRGITPPDGKQGPQRGVANPSNTRRGATDDQKRAYAASVWGAARAIPQGDDTPARRWLRERTLWWPGLPLPAAVQYVDQMPDGWPYGGGAPRAAAIVALVAPPGAWIAAWPEMPEPKTVQCVFINCDGGKAFPWGADRGDKRTIGPQLEGEGGGVVLIGDPRPTPDGELNVCEGLADGTGLAARGWETVAVTCTTPSTGGPFEAYAVRWGRVAVYGDDDHDGTRKAWAFVAALRKRGAEADRKRFDGYNDPAAAFGSGVEPLPDVLARHDDVREIADAWEADGLPRWEALRRGALSIVDADDSPTDDGEDPGRHNGGTNGTDDGTAPTQGLLEGMGRPNH